MENLPLTWEEVDGILKQIPDLKTNALKRYFAQGLFFRIRYAPGEIVMPKGVYSDFAGIHLSGGLRVLPTDPPASLMDAPALDCWRRPGPRFRRIADWVLDRTDRLPVPELPKEGEEAPPAAPLSTGERFGRSVAQFVRRRGWFKRRMDRRLAELILASPMLDSALDEQQLWNSSLTGLVLRKVTDDQGQMLPLVDRVMGLTAALWNQPRGATLVADVEETRHGPCELLLIKRTALLDIDKLSPSFHASREQKFREYDLPRLCAANALFSEFVDSPSKLESLARVPGLLLEFHNKGTDIFRQGDEATGLSMIVSGTVRVARQSPGDTAGRAASVTYLVRNNYFGVAAAFDDAKRSATLSAVTDVCLVTFSKPAMQEIFRIFPGLQASLQEEARDRARQDEDSEQLRRLPPPEPPEHLVQKLLQGRDLLLIDMDLCTRCDQCVRACAAAHDNIPRFHRANPDLRFGKWEVAAACVHCIDAPCQQACPVGAITFLSNGMVHIHRSRCIGCRSCVDPCPFDVIEMLERSSPEEAPVTSKQKAFAVATKCDLCLTDVRDPPCVASCPYGAAQRGAPDELFPGIGQLRTESPTMTISSFSIELEMD